MEGAPLTKSAIFAKFSKNWRNHKFLQIGKLRVLEEVEGVPTKSANLQNVLKLEKSQNLLKLENSRAPALVL